MPGTLPNTSTYALTNVTLRYAVALANHGVTAALAADPALAAGLNIIDGYVVNNSVSQAHGFELTDWHALAAARERKLQSFPTPSTISNFPSNSPKDSHR